MPNTLASETCGHRVTGAPQKCCSGPGRSSSCSFQRFLFPELWNRRWSRHTCDTVSDKTQEHPEEGRRASQQPVTPTLSLHVPSLGEKEQHDPLLTVRRGPPFSQSGGVPPSHSQEGSLRKRGEDRHQLPGRNRQVRSSSCGNAKDPVC